MIPRPKFAYIILAAILIISMAGPAAYGLDSSATELDDAIKTRIARAVVIYPGSMYALSDNALKAIDPKNDLITPFIQNGRTLAPVRFIAEAFGGTVSWDDVKKTATIVIDDKTITIALYSTKMTVDGKTVTLDVPATVTGGRTFIPVRALSEALGKEVFFDRGLVVLSDTPDIFDPVADKALIDGTIAAVNILPVVGTREKLVTMLNNAGAGNTYYTLSPDGQTDNAAPSEGGQSGSDKNSPDYSGTNIQVEGVDEADIVKTDGTYIYQVSNQDILIYKVYPASEMALMSKISFADQQFAPQELYIMGNTLIVIGSAYSAEILPATDAAQKDVSIYPIYNSPTTETFLYDVSDRSNPVKTRQLMLEGYYLSSRLIGSDLYLVSNQYIYYWQDDATPLNPQYRDTKVGPDMISVPYEDIRYMPPVVSQSYLMIAGLSLDEPDKPLNVETYLGAGEDIYVSQDNLYVTVNEGYGGIRPMLITDAGFMPPQEQEATLIYKFALNDGSAAYLAKGQVPGRVLNQFSMDESNGCFRIATTVGYSWMGGANALNNNVYVLDSNLAVTGRLEGLAKGETIYSVRFMGDRAYVVTFRTVDPLFVIDLGDPWNPAVLGALKIPGYSDYLHPYDEDHIIGFGKDAITVPVKDSAGNTVSEATYYLGMKVALFDVSDVSNPVLEYSVNIGDRGTESELLYDHKALLFDAERHLLAFPVNETKVDGPLFDPVSGYPNYGELVFSGAYVYDLSLENGFVLKGKLSHLSDADYAQYGYGGLDYNKEIRRVLFIDSVLYGVSNSMISAYDLGTLNRLGDISGT